MLAEQGCRAPKHPYMEAHPYMVAEQSYVPQQSTIVHHRCAHLGRSSHLTSKTRSRRETLEPEHHSRARVLSAWKTRLEQLTGFHTSNGKDRCSGSEACRSNADCKWCLDELKLHVMCRVPRQGVVPMDSGEQRFSYAWNEYRTCNPN